MKVLLVSNMYPDNKNPSYGIFVAKFATELDKVNIQYDRAVMQKRNGMIGKVVEYLRFYIRAFCMALFGSYDVIYIHYASHSSAPILAAGKFRKLVIYTNVHGSDVVPENSRQQYMQKYTKKVLEKSQKVIVPSLYFKNYVKEKYGVNGSEIYIYPSAGIDLNVFHEMSKAEIEEERKKLADNIRLPIFGMAGRISSGKGWDVFVKAVKLAKKNGVDAIYVIVGSGPEEGKLEEFIEQNDLKGDIKRINLLPQEALCRFYSAIDYLVFPTKREGESLGLVALEAMACGTPVIASNFAAPKYYIENGVNGYQFEVNNPSDLAERIEFCAQNRNIRLEMKEGALRTANQYTNDSIRYELIRIFDEKEIG